MFWSFAEACPGFEEETFVDTIINKLTPIFEESKEIIEAELASPDFDF